MVLLNNRRKKTDWRFLQLMRKYGIYPLLILFTAVLLGMRPGYKQHESGENLPVAMAGKEDIGGGCDKKNTIRSQNRISLYDAGNPDTKSQLVFDLEPSSPSEKWQTVHDAITRCAKLDLTVWYAFGSARLKIHPEGRQCRMEWIIEGELSETNHRQGFTCHGDPAIFKELDLVHDEEVLREIPPKELPEALKPFCQPMSTNQ